MGVKVSVALAAFACVLACATVATASECPALSGTACLWNQWLGGEGRTDVPSPAALAADITSAMDAGATAARAESDNVVCPDPSDCEPDIDTTCAGAGRASSCPYQPPSILCQWQTNGAIQWMVDSYPRLGPADFLRMAFHDSGQFNGLPGTGDDGSFWFETNPKNAPKRFSMNFDMWPNTLDLRNKAYRKINRCGAKASEACRWPCEKNCGFKDTTLFPGFKQSGSIHKSCSNNDTPEMVAAEFAWGFAVLQAELELMTPEEIALEEAAHLEELETSAPEEQAAIAAEEAEIAAAWASLTVAEQEALLLQARLAVAVPEVPEARELDGAVVEEVTPQGALTNPASIGAESVEQALSTIGASASNLVEGNPNDERLLAALQKQAVDEEVDQRIIDEANALLERLGVDVGSSAATPEADEVVALTASATSSARTSRAARAASAAERVGKTRTTAALPGETSGTQRGFLSGFFGRGPSGPPPLLVEMPFSFTPDADSATCYSQCMQTCSSSMGSSSSDSSSRDETCSVSFADMLQVAGAAAVESTSGPDLVHKIKFGRCDANKADTTVVLPAPIGMDLSGMRLLPFYNAKYCGTVKTVVATSGAHTIGHAHSRKVPRSCARFVEGSSEDSENMDLTPHLFDTEYFKGLARAKCRSWFGNSEVGSCVTPFCGKESQCVVPEPKPKHNNMCAFGDGTECKYRDCNSQNMCTSGCSNSTAGCQSFEEATSCECEMCGTDEAMRCSGSGSCGSFFSDSMMWATRGAKQLVWLYSLSETAFFKHYVQEHTRMAHVGCHSCDSLSSAF